MYVFGGGSDVVLPFGAPADFLAAPTKTLVSKNKKKSKHFFGAPFLPPPGAFFTPNIFFVFTER